MKKEYAILTPKVEKRIGKQLEFETKIPEFKVVNGKKWVFYGDDNQFPQYLLEMYQRSAKHNAIINGKVNYIFGGGLTFDSKTLDSTMIGQLSKLMDNANQFDSLNDVYRKTIIDNEIFNGYCMEIIWSFGGKISSIAHVPFNEIRVAVDGKKYYRSKMWNESSIPKDLDEYEKFNPKHKFGKQLYYCTTYSPGCYYYPIPEYFGAMAYIETDCRISNYHVENLRNGFLGGFIFNFNNGVPALEQQKVIEKKIKSKFGGDDGERILISFNDGKENGMELIPVHANDLDKQFDILNQTIQQEIFTAHRVTSGMLFGIKESGQLGGRNELIESYELFKSVYVKDRANEQLRSYNYLFGFNGYGNVLESIPTAPINQQLTETTLLQIASRGELRDMIGLPDDTASIPKVTNSIQALSPLVANKVLEQMSRDEVRSLVGLQSQPIQPSQTTQQFGQSDDDILIEHFSNCGVDANDFIELKKRPMKYGFEKRELEFANEYDDIDLKILGAISENPSISSDEIAKKLNLDKQIVSDRITALVENGSIKINGTLRELGDSSKDLVKTKTSSPLAKIMYKYDVLPEFGPEKIIDGSRNFCRAMIKLNRYYSRDDINQISEKMGYSVWERRGGWLHDSDTGLTTPSCRHIWIQSLVKQKS